MTGTVVRVQGIKRYRHPKTGIVYCYHRASGIAIKTPFGSPEFFAELASLNSASSAKPAPKPGTLGTLFEAYRASERFRALRPRVRRGYEDAIARIERLAAMPLDDVSPGFVAQLRDKITAKHGWKPANEVRKVLSVAFSVACELGLAERNPVKETRRAVRPKDLPRRNRPWDADERRAVLREAPAHLRLPIVIGMHTGLREGDVLRLPKTARRGRWLVLTTQKTLEPVELPMPRALIFALEQSPPQGAITLCATSRGKPWTNDGFRASLRTFMKGLEAKGTVRPGLTFHGLRHSFGNALKEAGASDEDIAAWLTHRSLSMARHYSRDASRREQMKATVEKLETHRRRRGRK